MLAAPRPIRMVFAYPSAILAKGTFHSQNVAESVVGNDNNAHSRELIDVTVPLANGERLPSKAFIYVAGPDGWQEHFDRLPPYSELNERGELDWRPGPLHGPVIR